MTAATSPESQATAGTKEKSSTYKTAGLSTSAVKAKMTAKPSGKTIRKTSTNDKEPDQPEPAGSPDAEYEDEDDDQSAASEVACSPNKRAAPDDENAPAPRIRKRRLITVRNHDHIRPSKLMPTFTGGPSISMNSADGSSSFNDHM